MVRIVTSAHRPQYPNPISFHTGEIVTLGGTDDEFPGWIRARLVDGNEGWAPQEILQARPDGTAVATAEYDGRELDTVPGEHLEVLRELNGWFWARNPAGHEGWVPLKNTAPSNS